MTMYEALKFTLKFEGGLSDHPDDHGGLTYKGITHSVYSSWLASKGRPDRSVRHMTRDEMELIYKERYWEPMRAQWLSAPLALTVFDTAVNLGVGGCTRRLQMALGVPVTGKWTQAISDNIHKADQVEVALAICKLRIAKRHERVEKEESQKVFLKGWLNRDNALIKEVKRLASITALSDEEEGEKEDGEEEGIQSYEIQSYEIQSYDIQDEDIQDEDIQDEDIQDEGDEDGDDEDDIQDEDIQDIGEDWTREQLDEAGCEDEDREPLTED